MQPIHAVYPMGRFRRTRRTAALRDLCQEVRLSTADLIWPLFVRDGAKVREPVASMPGVDRLSVDLVVEAARQAADLGPTTAARRGTRTIWRTGRSGPSRPPCPTSP
jgi:porphobilinogen synthase